MSRSNLRLQPPSPPMSANGDQSLHVVGSAHFDPYTPPGSVGPFPHEQIHGPVEEQIPYFPTTEQQPSYYSPQVTFTRNINDHATPIGTKSITTRSGLRLVSPDDRRIPQRSRRGGGASSRKRNTDTLPGPLSEITREYTVPVRDMEAWVNRPVEQRLRETAAKHGHVARPMNSFMLYRSAYAERVKQYCRENNHQVVSKVTGQSWPIETPEIRDLYKRLASEEKNNHQAAHPTYKFTPNKNGKKRARQADSDVDSDGDSEWTAPRQAKRVRAARSHGRRTVSPSPYASEAGYFTIMRPPSQPHPSSYRTANPQGEAFHDVEESARQGTYPHMPPVPFQSNVDDISYHDANLRYSSGVANTDFGLTGMPDGSNDLLVDSSYPPLYSVPTDQYIDPNLGQLDGIYTYEDSQGPGETYLAPRPIPRGSYLGPPTLYYQDNVHPGMAMLSGNSGGWYNIPEPESEFDRAFSEF